jgi:predicted RNase H-like nuclease
MSEQYVMGVDGCKSGWLVCRYSLANRDTTFRVLATFAEVLDLSMNALRVAVDIPIGLTARGESRACDREARQILGWPRRNSVFSAPSRCLLEENSYSAACARSRSLARKAISKQTYSIFGKIAEVDRAMETQLQDKIFEMHPEVSFWSLDERPTGSSRKSRTGYEERRQLIRQALGWAGPDRNDVRRLNLHASPDDLLDACIGAMTALKGVEGKANRLPSSRRGTVEGCSWKSCTSNDDYF